MIALTNCRAVTITDGLIEKATILIEGGLIKAVGAGCGAARGRPGHKPQGEICDPGIYRRPLPFLGHGRAQARGGGDDGNEVSSPVTAHIRIVDALDPFGIAIPLVRTAGFTTCYTMPGSANIIGGHGYCIQA